MKSEAEEKLLISVDSVTPFLGQSSHRCIVRYDAKATVIGVNSTNHGYQQGDSIDFETYYYDSTSINCRGFGGPSSPPMLNEGWCGYAYLNDDGSSKDDDSTLQLAANGYSLEEEPTDKCIILYDSEGPTRKLTPQAQTSDEILLISVTNSSPLLGGDGSIYDVSGEVEGVKKTTLGFTNGDTVHFQLEHQASYSPVPGEGWCGIVHLSDASATTTQETLQLDGTMDPVHKSQCQETTDEVLLISVTNSSPLLGGDRSIYDVTGEVEDVKKTTLGFTAGETVHFQLEHQASYAPVPTEGWCGIVHLSDGSATSTQDMLKLDGTMDAVSNSQCQKSSGSDENLLVYITNEEPMLGQTSGTPIYLVTARVFGVKETTLGFGMDDDVEFQVKHCDTCTPLPPVGSCGYVQLDDGSATTADGILQWDGSMEQVNKNHCKHHVRRLRGSDSSLFH